MQSKESHRTANFRYAVALASDDDLAKRYPREIGRRLLMSSAGLVRERVRAQMGLRSLLPMTREVRPAATAATLRAVALAVPDLGRLALQKVWR